jgi:hypothetical protein
MLINNKGAKMIKDKKLPSLYNTVDKLVSIRNTYNDYKPKYPSKTTKNGKLTNGACQFMLLENDLNQVIKTLQKYYNFIDYDKLYKAKLI